MPNALPEAIIDELATRYCEMLSGRNFVQTHATIRQMAEDIAVALALQPVQADLSDAVLMPRKLTGDMKTVLKEAAPRWNAESIYASLIDAAILAAAKKGQP